MKALLFDMDGTLLPGGLERVLDEYLQGIAAHAMPEWDAKQVIHGIYRGFKAMVADADPLFTNEQVFQRTFTRLLNLEDWGAYEKRFMAYYQGPYDLLGAQYTPDERVLESIALAKQKGYVLVVATNPLFPRIAIEKRLRWAGLDPDDFALITDYHNMHACKPQLAYYRQILSMLSLDAKDCIMVGNDAEEDMVAGKLGMATFYLNETPVQRAEKPAVDYEGGYPALLEFVRALPEATTCR